ncbi:hypothetical protein CRU86_00070 [Aliarcobacter skirrowii]|uniref:hypothetical protein n=1 Tax=Aliarcobacter skirrowii TaxID=28200 RepID=UPI00100B6389|nr:hypothetical protein [Aliarcobacter skirrowii]RXJ80807.1 hypothetical protein CRU86_00070 [Aliarcobacter skirrowii]
MTKTMLMLFIFVLIITGCATKVKTEYVYKKVNIPVKCNVELPKKPLNDGSFETHKQKMIYYITVEDLLMKCKGVENESK